MLVEDALFRVLGVQDILEVLEDGDVCRVGTCLGVVLVFAGLDKRSE